VDVLREEIRKTYTDVSTDADQDFIFPTGRPRAEELAYPQPGLARVPEATVESFAGVANHWTLGRIEPGSVVLDLGCGAGTDLLIAAQMTGPDGRVIGVDMTSSMLERAQASAREMGIANVELHESLIDRLPLDDDSVDTVISNGVIDLVPDKTRCSTRSTASCAEAGVCSSPTWSSTPRSPRTRAPASTCGPAESPARSSKASTRACWSSGRTPTSPRANSSTPTRARATRTPGARRRSTAPWARPSAP
jgi:arsenite methyltransferase